MRESPENEQHGSLDRGSIGRGLHPREDCQPLLAGRSV